MAEQVQFAIHMINWKLPAYSGSKHEQMKNDSCRRQIAARMLSTWRRSQEEDEEISYVNLMDL